MDTEVTTRRMTAEQFCDWTRLPENENRWFELVRGEVIELPPPMKPHGVVAIQVGRLLANYADQVGKGYLTSNDSGVILVANPDTVRGPDIAVLRGRYDFRGPSSEIWRNGAAAGCRNPIA